MPWALALVAAVVALAAGVGASPAQAIEPSGTFIQVPGTAPIYRVVGGAAIHVDSCAPLGGCPGLVHVANLNGYASTPANGSFFRYADGPSAGWIGEFVGGTPIHVDTCAPLAGCPGTINIDAGGATDYIHAHPTPANGSFVLVADGAAAGEITRAAGGALIRVTDCVALGGCGYVTLDAGGFRDYAAAHPVPADGTLLRGVPSGTTWEVLAGERVAVAPSPAAVALNDESLAAIPIAPTRASGTGVRRLRPARPHRRIRVKITLSWRWDLGRTQLVRVVLGRVRRGMTVRIRCTGRGCPRRAMTAGARRAPRALRALDGLIYHAGDRLLIVISARGRTPERARVVFRYGRIPRATLLR